MSLYSLALFAHIVASLVLFATLVAEPVNWGHLLGALDVRQARAGVLTATQLSRVASAAMLTLFGSGGYLMVSAWGPRPWLTVALLSTLPLAVLSVAVPGRSLSALRRALSRESEALPEGFVSELRRPALVLSTYVRAAIVLAIVFLMTSKPDARASLLTLLAAVALGVAVALATRAAASVREL